MNLLAVYNIVCADAAGTKVPLTRVAFVFDDSMEIEDNIERVAAKLGFQGVEALEWETLEFTPAEGWDDQIRKEWKIDTIVSRVLAAAKELDNRDETHLVQSIGLGSLINPSGKFYVPFACSNVSGDCPVCAGDGHVRSIGADKVKRSRARYAADKIRDRLSRRHGFYVDWPPLWKRLLGAADRVASECAATATCPVCDGNGSKSATDDERWREAFEDILKPHDMNLEQSEHDSCFYLVTKYTPAEETSEAE